MDEIDDEAEAPNILSAIPTILWQRRWLLIIPTVVALVLGVIAAFVIPPIYRSQAVIVIESQQLPSGLVDSPVTDVIDQRIARVRQRVLSRPDLIQLIRANNLYAEERKSKPLSKIIEEMRDATSINVISADMNTGGGWRGGAATDTIAFTIGFEYSDPAKAQIVAQQYVNHFLETDAAAQAEQAVGSATFLGEQASAIQAKIRDIEAEMTKIKAENGSILALGEQTTGDPASDAARIDSEISSLVAQNAQLATMAMRNDDSAVGALQQQLTVAEAKYSDTHPDVIALKAQLAAAKQAARSAPQAANPNRAQIAGNNAQIAALRGAKAMLLSQSAETRAARARAPAIGQHLDQLEKQADGLREQYRQIGSKLVNAQVSARMETEQKGERMTLADPPVQPDTPIRPNRPLIILGSIVLGLGLGLGLTLVLELFFRPIRGTAALGVAAGALPLVVIPPLDRKPSFLVRWLEKRSRRKLVRSA
ncbi:MAG TPA: Wzz/FepE/Etk N-terminal domain-containing protein [Sphingomonadaceae bacterium]|nr:Wzz/FepE/Etk N-terminal domain-containing protein [Sphingomonadaceae bacterium]